MTLSLKLIALATSLLLGSYAFAQSNTVDVLHWWTTGGTAAAAAKLKEAAKAAGVEWKDVAVAGNENQRTLLRTRVLKGDAPGAAQLVTDIAIYADQRDQLLSLNVIAKEQNWEKVLPPVINDYVKAWGRDYVAVPLNAHRLSVMFTNTKLLKQLGAKTPTNWEEFFAVADKAKAAGITPFAWGNRQVTTITFDQIAMSVLGPQNFKQAFNNGDEKILASKDMTKVFEHFRRLANYADKSQQTKPWVEGAQGVVQGKILFQIMGDWAKSEYVRAGMKINDDFTCTPVPGTAKSYQFIPDAFLFFKTKNDSSAAQLKLARALMDKSTQEAFNLVKGSVPARNDVDMSKFDECAKKSYSDFNAAGKAGTLVMFWGTQASAPRYAAMTDVVMEYFAKPEMTAEQGRAKLAAASKAN